MTSEAVITEGLPEGWIIKPRWEMDGQDSRLLYTAYRHRRKVIEKKVLGVRLSAYITGWKRTTITGRKLDQVKSDIWYLARQEATR